MATFETGLIPHVRLELIREDPSLTYQASRTRAEKHETNALRAAPTPSPTTYASAVTGTSPGTRPTVNHIDGQHRKGNRVQTDGGTRPGQKRDVRSNSIWPVRQAGQVAEWRRGEKYESKGSGGQRM